MKCVMADRRLCALGMKLVVIEGDLGESPGLCVIRRMWSAPTWGHSAHKRH